MVISQDAVTACVLLHGYDLTCIVFVKHHISYPESEWRESVNWETNGGLPVK